MPQTGKADVIYTDLHSNPQNVGFGTGVATNYAITNLPGAEIGFKTATAKTVMGNARLITVSQQAGYARFKTLSHIALPTSAGKVWHLIQPRNSNNIGRIAEVTYNGHYPGSYSHLYLPFEFKDSTQAGSPLRFGWMEVSLNNPTNAGTPVFTLFGYAWDNTGFELPMGATTNTPEPSSVSMMVLGALTLGAAGVRNWRRKKNPKPE
jgi:hypothetical protein